MTDFQPFLEVEFSTTDDFQMANVTVATHQGDDKPPIAVMFGLPIGEFIRQVEGLKRSHAMDVGMRNRGQAVRSNFRTVGKFD